MGIRYRRLISSRGIPRRHHSPILWSYRRGSCEAPRFLGRRWHRLGWQLNHQRSGSSPSLECLHSSAKRAQGQLSFPDYRDRNRCDHPRPIWPMSLKDHPACGPSSVPEQYILNKEIILKQRNYLLTFMVSWILLNDDCSWVAYISDEKMAAIGHNTHTSRSTVANISAHIANFIISLWETVEEGRMDLVEWWVCR